ncbi:MAG TPA: protein kinase, partial [Alphaproteobacteria bacterium]
MDDARHGLARGYTIEGYRIERVLGAGGFGITYLATEVAISRPVAIKEYLPNGIAARSRNDISVQPLTSADNENYQWGLERFRREAQTLVAFHHPNIVSVFRYFEANGTAYLVMAYEDGESLAAILDKRKTLPEAELRSWLAPLLSGLAHVHKAGFLHRDIKPGNIYIRRDGSPVLLDFGAARLAVGGRSQSLTSIVSAGYAPFEQYTTRGNQGPWTDIYAMGGVLYRAITGQRPPDAPDRIRDDPYEPAAKAARGKYGAGLLAAVDAALIVDEETRPQSLEQWLPVFEGAPWPPPCPDVTVGETSTKPPAAAPDATLAVGGQSAPREREEPTRWPTGAPSIARPTAPPVARTGEPRPRAGSGKWFIIGALVTVTLVAGGVITFVALDKKTTDSGTRETPAQ